MSLAYYAACSLVYPEIATVSHTPCKVIIAYTLLNLFGLAVRLHATEDFHTRFV